MAVGLKWSGKGWYEYPSSTSFLQTRGYLYGIRFIALRVVSALMIPSSILSGDSFYADVRIFNDIS